MEYFFYNKFKLINMKTSTVSNLEDGEPSEKFPPRWCTLLLLKMKTLYPTSTFPNFVSVVTLVNSIVIIQWYWRIQDSLKTYHYLKSSSNFRNNRFNGKHNKRKCAASYIKNTHEVLYIQSNTSEERVQFILE